MGTMLANFVASAILATLMLAVVVIPGFMLKRATSQVVRIFRARRSSCGQVPRTQEDLGLAPPDFMERLAKPKDYKPYALQSLINAGVVKVNDEGKLCLAEEKLREMPELDPEKRDLGEG